MRPASAFALLSLQTILGAGVALMTGPRLRAQPIYTAYSFSILAGATDTPGSADGPGPAARFTAPRGIAVDSGDTVYVSDFSSSTIRKIAPDGTVTTLAGLAGQAGSVDGTGSAARFSLPSGIAVDAHANVYVADAGNEAIRKITPAGVVTTIAGSPGQSGLVDGVGTAARFNRPSGVAVDSSGVLYVTDTGNNLIRRIGTDGTVTTIAGGGPAGSVDGVGVNASFLTPYAIAIDSQGNLFVSDSEGSLIRKVTPAGQVTTVAGRSIPPSPYNAYGLGAQIGDALGLAVDAAGDLLITDGGLHLVRRMTPAGQFSVLGGLPFQIPSFVAGTGPNARFETPIGIAVDPSGRVILADSDAAIVVSGTAVSQAPATVTLGNLVQADNGVGKAVSVTTSPPGLSTIVLYGGSASFAPSYQGTYGVLAVVTDPGFTGAAIGTLTILPGPSSLPPFTQRHQNPGGSFLWGVTAGPSGLVCVGTNGTILTSTDGSTWTRRSSGSAQWLTAVTFGGGQYVAVGDSGTVLLSPDGAQWTNAGEAATTQRLNNILYAAGQYVAVGEGGAIITSPDGHAWTARSSGLTGWLRGLVHLDSFTYLYGWQGADTGTEPARFVAAGQGGTFVQSTDGVAWSVAPTGLSFGPLILGSDVEALVPTPGDLAAVGANGTAFSGSWSAPGGTLALSGLLPPDEYLLPVPIIFPGDFRCLVRTSFGVIAAGYNGVIVAANDLPYDPGYFWQQVDSGTHENLVNGVAVGDSVFIVGSDETILESNPPPANRLVNLSCRASVGGAAGPLITGFAVGGKGTTGSCPLLIRSSGPALVPFGIADFLSDPDLDLYSTSAGAVHLAANSGWAGGAAVLAEAEQVGAFAWTSDSSHDAALALSLGAGPYTANVTSQSGGSGVALTEVYDATEPANVSTTSPRLVNLSARTMVGTGGNILIAGFVITGQLPKTVLIRASGPALAAFGVGSTLSDPKLEIFSAATSGTPVASNTGWGGDAAIATAASWVGAFSWGSQTTPDSAILVALPPGAYTAQVSGAMGDTGNALIEVYEVQ